MLCLIRTRRDLWPYLAYEFGSSVLFIVYFLFFSKWLVVERGLPDTYFNVLLALSSCMLFVATPVCAYMIDRQHRVVVSLRVLAVVVTCIYALCAGFALFAPAYTYSIAVVFLLALFFHLFSGVFLNAYMVRLSTAETRAEISGLGMASSGLGQIGGIVLALPFVLFNVVVYGEPGPVQTFLPAVIAFFLCTLPLLISNDRDDSNVRHVRVAFVREYLFAFKGVRVLFAHTKVRNFFVAYLFFADGILTAASNFPLYMKRVHNASDIGVAVCMLLILITSAYGAYANGLLAKTYSVERMLVINALMFAIIFPLFPYMPNIASMAALVTYMGFWLGGIFALARAALANSVPHEHMGQAFSLYSLMERFATLVGPLVWAGMLFVGGTDVVLGYSLAIITMGALVFVSVLALQRM